MIWNETKECMSRDELTSLQSSRLVKLVDYVYHKNWPKIHYVKDEDDYL